MSKPRTYDNPIEGILSETTSAISALNMYPKPLPRLPNDDTSGFLADTDEWCRHAVEHLQIVIDLTLKVIEKGGHS